MEEITYYIDVPNSSMLMGAPPRIPSIAKGLRNRGFDGVRIRFKSVTRKEVRAVVEEVNEPWSHPARRGFEVGQELVLRRPHHEDRHWIIVKPKGLPWFVLSETGEFGHYR